MRNFFSTCVEKSIGPQKRKRILWVNFSEFGFSSIMFVCGVQVTSVELQCRVTETNLCAGSGLGASQVCHQPSI